MIQVQNASPKVCNPDRPTLVAAEDEEPLGLVVAEAATPNEPDLAPLENTPVIDGAIVGDGPVSVKIPLLSDTEADKVMGTSVGRTSVSRRPFSETTVVYEDVEYEIWAPAFDSVTGTTVGIVSVVRWPSVEKTDVIKVVEEDISKALDCRATGTSVGRTSVVRWPSVEKVVVSDETEYSTGTTVGITSVCSDPLEVYTVVKEEVDEMTTSPVRGTGITVGSSLVIRSPLEVTTVVRIDEARATSRPPNPILASRLWAELVCGGRTRIPWESVGTGMIVGIVCVTR